MGRNYIILPAIISLLITSSCHGDFIKKEYAGDKLVQKKLQNNKQRLMTDREHPIKMGYGYDSRTGMSVGLSCMNNFAQPGSLEINNQRANAHLSSTTDAETIANMLNTGISGRANFGLYSASLSAQFARSVINTRQSLHFNYWQSMVSDVTYNTNGIGNASLSADARYLLEHGEVIKDFTEICGDSFIKSAQLGAVLFIDFAVHFASAEAKTAFETKISGKALGLASMEAIFSKMDKSITNNASVEVQAMQLGGDVTKFAEIFGEKDPNSNNYHVTSCAAQNMADCYKMINDVIDYARNYLDKSVNFKNPETLYTFGFTEKTYKSLGVKAYLPDLSPQEQEAKDYIARVITADRKMLEYLHSYQKQHIMSILGIETKNQISKVIEKYELMIKEYDNYQIIDSCYGDISNIETKCLLAANRIKDMHSSYKEYIEFANNLSSTILIKNKTYDSYNHETGEIYWVLLPMGMSSCDQVGKECLGLYALYRFNDHGMIEYTNRRCYVDTTKNNELAEKTYKQVKGKIFVCEWFNRTAFVLDKYLKRVKLSALDSGVDQGVMGYYAIDNRQVFIEEDERVGEYQFNSYLFTSISPEFTYNPI